GVLLLGQVHVDRVGALAAEVGDALLEGVVLADAEALDDRQFDLGAFGQGGRLRSGHGQTLSVVRDAAGKSPGTGPMIATAAGIDTRNSIARAGPAVRGSGGLGHE